MSDPSQKAANLRELHRRGDPLVLANAWDAVSARAVEAAGFPAVATTSAGMAESLGYEDHQVTPPEEMLAAVARITRAVSVPVTADLEGGYGLAPRELVERMLEAGAVGLNFEDTDHDAGGTTLVEAERQAERIRELRAAGQDAGVEIVINARVDPYVRRMERPLDESVTRGRLYLDAGADCVFPILARDEADIARLVEELDAPVNVLLIPGVPELPRLAELGVARVSVGGGLAHAAQRSHEERLDTLRAGRTWF